MLDDLASPDRVSSAITITDPDALVAHTTFAPAPREFHKPTKSGTGAALKLHLRLLPKLVVLEESSFFDREANKQGGLFVELAAQEGHDGRGNATFGWRNQATLVRAKLGMADIQSLLVGQRRYRAGYDVPADLRGRDGQPNVISLFHKFERNTTAGQSKDTSAITYQLDEESGSFRISKSRELNRSIKLSMGEELVFVRYLELALDAFLRVGKR